MTKKRKVYQPIWGLCPQCSGAGCDRCDGQGYRMLTAQHEIRAEKRRLSEVDAQWARGRVY